MVENDYIKKYDLEVEKYISMDDEEGLENLNHIKGRYLGLYYFEEIEDIGFIWKNRKTLRVLYDDQENDRIIVYRVK